MILHLISYFHKYTANFGAEMVTFCIIHIGNRKKIRQHSPRVPTNPFARKCLLIFYIIYVKSYLELGGGGGGVMISRNPKCDVWASPNISVWIFGVLS